MVMLSVLNNPDLTLQLGILGKLLGLMGRIVKGCVREVSLAQVSCILMYTYVALPTPVGVWSMALGLRQRFEYYYYYYLPYSYSKNMKKVREQTVETPIDRHLGVMHFQVLNF